MMTMKFGMFVMLVFVGIKQSRLIRKKFYSFLVITLKIFQKKKRLYLTKKILIGQIFSIKINCTELHFYLRVKVSYQLPEIRGAF